MICFD